MFWLLLLFSTKAQVSISSSDSVICAGETVTLTALTPIMFDWCYWKAGSSTSSKTIAIHPSSDTLITLNCLDIHANSLTTSFTQTVFVCTDIRNIEFLPGVFLYPNPSSGKFKLSGLSEYTPIQVFNTLGKLILQTSAEKGITELDLTGNPAGIYFLNFEYKTQRILRKVVLE